MRITLISFGNPNLYTFYLSVSSASDKVHKSLHFVFYHREIYNAYRQ